MVRDYDRKDLKEIFSINKICFEKPESSIQLLTHIERGKTWIAHLDGNVVGFLIASYSVGKPYIYNIAVHPDHQNKGVGKSLIQRFEASFKGQGDPFLHVNENNPAKNLYLNLGYKVQTTKNNFYGPGQHALVMVKEGCGCNNRG